MPFQSHNYAELQEIRKREDEAYDRLQKEFGMGRYEVASMRNKLGRKTKTYDASVLDVLKYKEDQLAGIKKYQDKREKEKLKKQEEEEATKKRFEEQFPERAKARREAEEQEKRDLLERQRIAKEEYDRVFEQQRLLRVEEEMLMRRRREEQEKGRRREEYHKQMEMFREAHHEKLEARRQRRIEETNEFINTAKMGAEDVRGQQLREVTLEERRQQAMEKSLRVPNPSRAPSPAPVVTDTGYDSGTGSESEADERQRAMQRPKIEEGVVDRSHIFGEGRGGGTFGDMTGYGNTGVGVRMNIGSKHGRAKLDEMKAQEIRTKYWSNPDAEIGSGYSSFAKEYDVTGKTIAQVIERATWSGDEELYPLVAGEPEWLLFMPQKTERTIMYKANREELQLRKGGRIGLTDAPIVVQRKAKKENKAKE